MSAKSLSLGEIAELTSAELDGDPDFLILDAGTIRVCRPNWLTLVSDEKHFKEFCASEVTAAIVYTDAPPLNDSKITETPTGVKMTLRVQDPVDAFAKIVRLFRNMMKPPAKGIHPTATVSSTATLGEDITIGAGVVIGDNVTIGDHTCVLDNSVVMDGTTIGEQVIIFPNVVIYDNTQIGNRCILHAGCKLGAYGFGYDSSSGKHLLSDQLGYVVLEDEVEVGANACVDRGTFASTTIGQGTKLDNLVQIGHNCQIGKHNLICAQVGIAGSTTTGDYVVMGGQAGVADHVHIEPGTMVGAQSGIIGNISKGNYFGTPARDFKQAMREAAALSKVPDMIKRLKKLEKQLASQQEDQTTSDSADKSTQQDAA